MHTQKKMKTRWFKRFRKNDDGATAIEFAILGIPFAALVFGIVELAVVFFLTSTTEHAMATVSRQIRTGEFQGTGGGAPEFKAAICTAMATVGNCNKLRVDVITAATGKFTDLVLPDSPPPCDPVADPTCEDNPPAMPADAYTNTNSGAVVIVRVQYVHQLSVPNALTGLANGPGNTHIINAVTAFRNEPF